MAILPSEVVKGLPALTWRGLTAPCEAAPFQFSHTQVPRPFPYRDSEGHNWTRRNPIQFTVKLHFNNTVETDAFPKLYNQWQDALFDGSSGKLKHPILGILTARVLGGDVELVAQNQAGVVVQVTFTETNDDPENPDELSRPTVSTAAAAKAADKACQAAKIKYPKVVDPPVTDLEGFVGAIQGTIISVGLSVSGKLSMIGKFKGMVDQMIDTVTLEDNVILWPALHNLQVLRDSLNELEELTKANSRPTASRTVTANTTLSEFAASVNNSLTDVIDLNPTLLARPSIPAGTTIRYFTS